MVQRVRSDVETDHHVENQEKNEVFHSILLIGSLCGAVLRQACPDGKRKPAEREHGDRAYVCAERQTTFVTHFCRLTPESDDGNASTKHQIDEANCENCEQLSPFWLERKLLCQCA